MCERTYERFDENEYFLKYLTIHPILIYSFKEVDKKKKELQLFLVDELNKENISYDELSKKYNTIIELERQNKIKLDELRDYHKNIEEMMKTSYETNMIKIYDLVIKKNE
jgi:hypothetical protein